MISLKVYPFDPAAYLFSFYLNMKLPLISQIQFSRKKFIDTYNIKGGHSGLPVPDVWVSGIIPCFFVYLPVVKKDSGQAGMTDLILRNLLRVVH
jgi:hypothetical protein